MSGSSKPKPDCEAVRAELPALLYDEVTEDARVSVEDHLRSCETCRAELTAHRETMRLLDRWSYPAHEFHPPVPWAAASHRSRRDWWRPMLVGAAAALIAFTTLGVVGVSARYADGQLTVTLGRGGQYTPPAVTELRLAEHIPAFQTVARRTVDARMGVLLDALEADLVEMGRNEDRLWSLALQAADERRNADLRRFAVVVEALSRQQEGAGQRVRHFQDDMMAWRVSVDAQLAETPLGLHGKEKS